MMKTPYEVAIQCQNYIEDYDSEDVRDMIMEVMIGIGNYDVWTDVFSNDEDMLGRFKANKHRIIPREPLFVDYICGE